MSKKVLVVGGTGFLGKYLVAELTSRGYQVTAASRSPQLNSVASYQKLDVLDLIETEIAVGQTDLVINLTGQISSQTKDCFDLNSSGIYNLVTACNHHRKQLIQISTVLVYGSSNLISESSPLNPETSYAVLKAYADFLIQTLLPKHQQLIVRLSNLYGDYQSKGLCSYLLESVRADRGLKFPDNDGNLSRYFLHAADAARIITDLIDRHALGCYNVTGPEQWSIKELVQLIENITGRGLSAKYGTKLPVGNIAKINRQKLLKKIPGLEYRYQVKKYLKNQLV